MSRRSAFPLNRPKPRPSLFLNSGEAFRWTEAFREADLLEHWFPPRPKICWSVSAGHDMRPLVFLSDPMKRQLAEQSGLPSGELPKPDLHIFTSLATPGGSDGLHDLRPGRVVYQDHSTRVEVESYLPLHLDRERLDYRIERSFARFAEDPLDQHDHDAALLRLRLTCLQSGYGESVPVLYLAMENLNTFDTYLSRGPFDVQYLVATREGLGFGGCGRSILEHLYQDGRVLAGREHGFEPRYVVTWSDYTDGVFRSSATPIYPGLRRIAPYIKERGLPFDHQIYQPWP